MLNKLRVYTGGTFDLFHAGHVNLLRKCRQLGRVVVALNTDEFIYHYKGKTPVCSFEERAEVLWACRYVDEVVENIGGADSKVTIDEVKPDIIAIGTDWARKDYYTQMGFDQQYLDDRDISLIYVPYTWSISTTELKVRSANSHRNDAGSV
jgi:glycerol-3-phosphate cytidylyltransferase